MAEGRAIVTVLGGSSAWTPELAAALAAAAAHLPPLELRLVGRDPGRARNVARFCTALARRAGVDHTWRAVDSLADAARGARVVVNQMRIGGFAARARDERLPLRFGVPGDETIGPSALAAALRAARPTLRAAATVGAVAPDAWFVNLANPMGILLHALRASGLRCFGLCELPATTLAAGLALVGQERAAPSALDYLGINHQGFWCRIVVDGEDVVPRVLAAVAAREAEAGAPVPPFAVAAAVMTRFAALPLPYLRLYAHGEREVAAAQARVRSRGEELDDLAARLHAHYAACADGEIPAWSRARATPWLDLALAPALVALLGGPPACAYVSEPNAGHLPFLPADAIVEKRALLDAHGPRPWPLDARALAHGERNRLLAGVAAFEAAASSAACAPSVARVRRALAAHPFALAAATVDALAAATWADFVADAESACEVRR